MILRSYLLKTSQIGNQLTLEVPDKLNIDIFNSNDKIEVAILKEVQESRIK